MRRRPDALAVITSPYWNTQYNEELWKRYRPWWADDQAHFNEVGHRVIGQAVFNVIAQNCSFVGTKSIRLAKEGNLDITNTGGTQCTSRMIQYWLGR